MIADRGNAVPTCCDSSVPHPSLKLILKYIQQELSTSISGKCNSYSTPTFCSRMLIMTFDLIIITSCHMSDHNWHWDSMCLGSCAYLFYFKHGYLWNLNLKFFQVSFLRTLQCVFVVLFKRPVCTPVYLIYLNLMCLSKWEKICKCFLFYCINIIYCNGQKFVSHWMIAAIKSGVSFFLDKGI